MGSSLPQTSRIGWGATWVVVLEVCWYWGKAWSHDPSDGWCIWTKLLSPYLASRQPLSSYSKLNINYIVFFCLNMVISKGPVRWPHQFFSYIWKRTHAYWLFDTYNPKALTWKKLSAAFNQAWGHLGHHGRRHSKGENYCSTLLNVHVNSLNPL